MGEPIVRSSQLVEIHLLYASIVWLAAWVLTSIPGATATSKYWIWVATSLYFVLPLSPVVDAFRAPRPSWIPRLDAIVAAGNGISRSSRAIAAVGAVWLLGTLVMSTRLWLRIRADRRQARAGAVPGSPASTRRVLAHGIPVRFGGSRHAPAVDGVLRPRISLPDGIGRLLSEQELDAVLIHELTHARRGDNLIRLVHELGLCALWFHPLVWITGSRLALYRELSCDESVIRKAHGGDLVTALAKLAGAEDGVLLRARASSFLTTRLARLTAAEPRRTRLASTAIPTALFGAVLLAAVVATAAQTAGLSPFAAFAKVPCPEDTLVKGPAGVFGPVSSQNAGGVRDAVAVGISGGVKGGIAGGVFGGVGRAIPGGIRGGTPGGVSGGVQGGVSGGARGGTAGGSH